MRTFLIALFAFAFTSVTTVHAADVQTGFLNNPLEAETLTELLTSLLNILVQIGVVILTMMLVYCGFLFVTAQGNPEALSKAKSALIWTVIGGFLVLGAEVIAEAVESTVKAL